MLLQAERAGVRDGSLLALVVVTLRLGLEATAVALALGLPIACAVGLGRARLSRWGLIVANAGLGLPPVAVGVYMYLLISGNAMAPWGGRWIYTLNGMVLAQTILALPIIVAVSGIAIRSLPTGLIEQARAFGASGWRLGIFVLREARIGVLSAVIFALGSAFGEVGAVGLLGPTYGSGTSTLAVQIINEVNHGENVAPAVEHTVVLLAMMLALGLILAGIQHWDGRARRTAGDAPTPATRS
jgi:tungstate transport system permease protein